MELPQQVNLYVRQGVTRYLACNLLIISVLIGITFSQSPILGKFLSRGEPIKCVGDLDIKLRDLFPNIKYKIFEHERLFQFTCRCISGIINCQDNRISQEFKKQPVGTKLLKPSRVTNSAKSPRYTLDLLCNLAICYFAYLLLFLYLVRCLRNLLCRNVSLDAIYN